MADDTLNEETEFLYRTFADLSEATLSPEHCSDLANFTAGYIIGKRSEIVHAIEEELDDADQVTDTREKPNYITVWGVRRVLMRFGGKPHRWPVPAERCAECSHLSWNHYTTEQSLDGCAECSCLLSRREAEWGRDEEMDESIRQALYEDALVEGYDPEPDD